MRSPLGPTFVEFYLATTENKIIPKHKHIIYTRYVDDILVVMDTSEDVEELRDYLEDNLVLKFNFQNNTNTTAFPLINIQIKTVD